jgi:hypothetical protein
MDPFRRHLPESQSKETKHLLIGAHFLYNLRVILADQATVFKHAFHSVVKLRQFPWSGPEVLVDCLCLSREPGVPDWDRAVYYLLPPLARADS